MYTERYMTMIDRFERFSIAIAEASRYWHKLATDELGKYGLRGSHAMYLTTMYRYPEGITVPRLCELCGKDKSDASRMIGILEEKGLVTKKEVDGSLYRGLLILTPEGCEAAKHVSERACRVVELVADDLTDENREIFYESLSVITMKLRELTDSGIPE